MLLLPHVDPRTVRALWRRLDGWTLENFNPVLYRPRKR